MFCTCYSGSECQCRYWRLLRFQVAPQFPLIKPEGIRTAVQELLGREYRFQYWHSQRAVYGAEDYRVVLCLFPSPGNTFGERQIVCLEEWVQRIPGLLWGLVQPFMCCNQSFRDELVDAASDIVHLDREQDGDKALFCELQHLVAYSVVHGYNTKWDDEAIRQAQDDMDVLNS